MLSHERDCRTEGKGVHKAAKLVVTRADLNIQIVLYQVHSTLQDLAALSCNKLCKRPYSPQNPKTLISRKVPSDT